MLFFKSAWAGLVGVLINLLILYWESGLSVQQAEMKFWESKKKKGKLSYIFFFLFYRLIMLISQRWKWLSRATSGNLADWKRTAALQGSCEVWSMEESKNEKVNQAHVLFDRFVQASTCKGTLKAFQELCDYLELKPKDYRSFYHKLKSKLNYWKAKALWAKLDKRGSHKDYKKGKACANTKVRKIILSKRSIHRSQHNYYPVCLWNTQ